MDGESSATNDPTTQTKTSTCLISGPGRGLPSRDGAGAGLQDVADHDVPKRRRVHAGALHHRLQHRRQQVIGGGGLESLFVWMCVWMSGRGMSGGAYNNEGTGGWLAGCLPHRTGRVGRPTQKQRTPRLALQRGVRSACTTTMSPDAKDDCCIMHAER